MSTRRAAQPPPTAESVVIMGVDPGTVVTGYGLIRITGGRVQLIAHGALRLDRYRHDQLARLKRIFDTISALLDEFAVQELAVEAPFFGTNVQSMLKLGRAQGVVMAAALARSLAVYEYPPARVKQSVTGRGAASKEQVRQMVLRLLPEFAQQEKSRSARGDASPLSLDTTDALAVALCHVHTCHRGLGSVASASSPARKKASKSKGAAGAWADFVAANPERVASPAQPTQARKR